MKFLFHRISVLLLASLLILGCNPDEEIEPDNTGNTNQNTPANALLGRWVYNSTSGEIVRYKTFYDNGTLLAEGTGANPMTVQYSYDVTNMIVFIAGVGRQITWHSSTSFTLESLLPGEDELYNKVN